MAYTNNQEINKHQPRGKEMNKEQIKTWLNEMKESRDNAIKMYESKISSQPESRSNARRLRSIGYKKEELARIESLISECSEQQEWMENMHIKPALEAWFQGI